MKRTSRGANAAMAAVAVAVAALALAAMAMALTLVGSPASATVIGKITLHACVLSPYVSESTRSGGKMN